VRDADKTKGELLNEPVELRQRVAELETSEAEPQQATEGLRSSHDFLNRVLNSMFEDLMVVDREYNIVDVNRCFVERYGRSYKDIIGSKCYEITHKRHRPCSEARHLCPLRTVLKTGLTLEVEHIHKDKEGKQLIVQINVFPLFGPKGEIEYIVEIQRDITERKQAEEKEKQLQEELNRSSRLAAIEELAAGVAHHINNPLTGILGFSQRLLRKTTNENIKKDLERIHNEGYRVAKVVENLLTFARRREPKREYANMNDIVQKALELRSYELKTSNIEVVTDLAPRLPEIIVDFHQIQEVFLNIILNAEQVMTEAHGGGKLTIITHKIKDYIIVEFADDGPGIPAEHLDKLFDPFFTTRGEKGGTGLGLSVCHGIVTKHGGRIYAKSKPGKGATFIVEFPLTLKRRRE